MPAQINTCKQNAFRRFATAAHEHSGLIGGEAGPINEVKDEVDWYEAQLRPPHHPAPARRRLCPDNGFNDEVTEVP